MSSKRNEHIDIKYHWIRQKVGEKRVVHLIHDETNDMVADILTKLLSAEPFERHVGNITGMNYYSANCAGRIS